ncbi:DNA-3-methyladenine glycosylase [Phaeobacter sp. CECT 5382]|uniref:DNA-3-methyladenine glycosylase family protein n=1 Tax=Phaeobacter sp. CECT 5382 TaxID=1712645 RepID=UPI0006DB96EB|nr:DNA-3-methyladenine glycosylase 2 family protein [Phaeobacter sp. CECT 5382]CUH88319.1 DNA-3-methyladenine glycosylase [Phaeobacter sp. CECT 5382]
MTSIVLDCAPAAGRIIRSDACVSEGADWLANHDDRFAQALDLCGPLPLRRKPDGFAELLSAIVSQQVSVASARAIWQRLQDAGLTCEVAVLAKTEEELRGIGLSRQKAKYARALAGAGIYFNALRDAPTENVIKTLTQVSGIGVWTAEIYAMFSLGRADVFAPGDLALQEAARVLFALEERPKERALREMAKDWSPWRSVAARILWAYYHVAKDREGIR